MRVRDALKLLGFKRLFKNLIFGVALLLICSVRSQAETSVPKPQLEAARDAYFKSIQGDAKQARSATNQFAELGREHPGDPLVEAYLGSLDLLEAGRSWQVWNQRELTQKGLAALDKAVKEAPDNLEVRFIRAATTWHLPFFFHRKEQAVEDFRLIAPKVEEAAREGRLPSPIAAAALNYYGQILVQGKNPTEAQEAFRAAVRVAPQSPAGREAATRIQ
jgi:tetratricopeptide (TPR) repeat protein